MISVNGSAGLAMHTQHISVSTAPSEGLRPKLTMVGAYALYEVVLMSNLWRVLNVPAFISGGDIQSNTITSDNLQWATLPWGKVAMTLNDFDTVKSSGLYIWYSGSKGTPPNASVTGVHYFVIHMRLNDSYEFQMAVQINATFVYMRCRQGGKWISWVKLH